MESEELWHIVEARRDDGSPTIFRIRELEARLEQPHIFVAELPYPVTELSKLPDAASYRRYATFQQQWLDPACLALDWTPVAVKIEDGSFFVYLYGAGDPLQLVARLSPFDVGLGFFDEDDPSWSEYAALRELLDEAKTMRPQPAQTPVEPVAAKPKKKPAPAKKKKTAPAKKQQATSAKRASGRSRRARKRA